MKLPEARKSADDSTDEDDTPTPGGETAKPSTDGEPTEFEVTIECPKCQFKEKNPNAKFCSECGEKFKKDQDEKMDDEDDEPKRRRSRRKYFSDSD